MKNSFDYVFSFILLVLCFPVMFLISVLVKVSSPGPVLYRGLRTGKNNTSFYILKFRTMVADADRIGGPTTGLVDPRVTQVGFFLRKYKLDEIPQLLNILRGEMSFVGPRPEVKQYTDLFKGEEELILSVKPGVTDYSSIKFSSLDEWVGSENVDDVFESKILPEKNRLRVKYVKEKSFWVDMKIIAITVQSILKKLRR